MQRNESDKFFRRRPVRESLVPEPGWISHQITAKFGVPKHSELEPNHGRLKGFSSVAEICMLRHNFREVFHDAFKKDSDGYCDVLPRLFL